MPFALEFTDVWEYGFYNPAKDADGLRRHRVKSPFIIPHLFTDRPFPYQGTRVLVDRSLLGLRRVWLEAGSPRHVLGLGPRQLLRLTRAETGTFLLDD